MSRVGELIDAFAVADAEHKAALAGAFRASTVVRETATRRGAVLIELREALAAVGVDVKELSS